jgi:cytochrome c oxidase subunit 2
MLASALVVFVVVFGALLWACWRAPRATPGREPDAHPAAARRAAHRPLGQRGSWRVVHAALSACSSPASAPIARSRQLPLTDAVNIRVTAHQWWWEVTY